MFFGHLFWHLHRNAAHGNGRGFARAARKQQ
jgi:hypothetical protein